MMILSKNLIQIQHLSITCLNKFIAAGLNEDEANKYEAIVKEAKRYKTI